MSREEKPRDGAEGQSGPITVEWGMPLMIRIKGFSESHKSTLVGMERGDYLICSMPAIPGLWAKLRDHENVIVRYVHKGTVYGFKCTLLNIMDKPFRLMVLSYPTTIETVRLRKQERIACFIPITMDIDGETLRGMVRDISMEGCGIALSNSREAGLLEVKAPAEAALSMQILGSRVHATIEVVNSRRHNNKLILGSRFKDLTADASAGIQTYIDTMAELDEGNPV